MIAAYEVEQGGLPRPIGSEDAQDLARPHRETHVVQHPQSPEGLSELLRFEQHLAGHAARRG